LLNKNLTSLVFPRSKTQPKPVEPNRQELLKQWLLPFLLQKKTKIVVCNRITQSTHYLCHDFDVSPWRWRCKSFL